MLFNYNRVGLFGDGRMKVNSDNIQLKRKGNLLYIDYYDIKDVFHYTNIDSLEKIILNDSFKITNCKYVNDKTELDYPVKLIEKLYNIKRNSFGNIYPKDMIDLINYIKKRFEESYILSFSVKDDSLVLWGNYSEFEGYNLSLSVDKIINKFNQGNIYVVSNNMDNDGNYELIQINTIEDSILVCSGKVIYDLPQQKSIILDELDRLNILYNKAVEQNSRERRQELIRIYSSLASFSQLFKDPCFEQEEEYRIIFTIKENLDVIKFKKSRGVFIPYIEIVFRENNNENKKGLPIERITIGPKNNMDIAAKGLRGFLRSNGYKAYLENEIQGERFIIKKSKIPLRY